MLTAMTVVGTSTEEKTLFSFMPESDTVPLRSQSSTNDYLTASCVPMCTNPAKFWKEYQAKYSSLAKLSKEVLKVPSSSAPVERLFSIAGKIFTLER